MPVWMLQWNILPITWKTNRVCHTQSVSDKTVLFISGQMRYIVVHCYAKRSRILRTNKSTTSRYGKSAIILGRCIEGNSCSCPRTIHMCRYFGHALIWMTKKTHISFNRRKSKLKWWKFLLFWRLGKYFLALCFNNIVLLLANRRYFCVYYITLYVLKEELINNIVYFTPLSQWESINIFMYILYHVICFETRTDQ